MMKKRILLALLTILLLSCSSGIKRELQTLGVIPREQSKEYLDAFVKATKQIKYYEQFETRSIIKVTYFSNNFLKAYLDERKKYMKNEDFLAFEDREKSLKTKTIKFFTSFYTPDQTYANLDKQKDLWQVYIEKGDGKRLLPTSIKKDTEPYPSLSYFFPTVDPWSTPFIITFNLYENEKPILKEGDAFKLVFKSVLSYSEFSFIFE